MFTGDCVTARQNRNYAQIPEDTDVLITHSPAYGILDFDDDNINFGSEALLYVVSKIKPRIHLFGHIHKRHGITTVGTMIFQTER